MKSYRVIKFFTDLQDNNFAYHVGDTFPREGLDVSSARIKELSTKSNAQKTALIEEVSGKAEETSKESEANVDAPKKSKTKKSTKKTQE